LDAGGIQVSQNSPCITSLLLSGLHSFFLLQSESVTYHLRSPVLFHESFKPACSCIIAICSYFASLPSPIRDSELIIVGDRIFTDVVLANRMRLQNRPQKGILGSTLSRNFKKDGAFTAENESPCDATGVLHPFGPLSVWTTGVWERESMTMRWLENGLVKLVQRCSTPPTGEFVDTSQFLKVFSKPEPQGRLAELQGLFARLRRR
jgi:phosphatidylglycerophosphatase GEP4